jgi:predicted dehydrogenase
VSGGGIFNQRNCSDLSRQECFQTYLSDAMKPIRLITLAPGHFHAALVQKRMLPEVHRRSYVYAPLDSDSIAHLDRIAAFNSRSENPTNWEIDFRSSENWLERFVREQPGNTVVLSGRNRTKIDLMRLAVSQGLHVLADKPWVVEYADFPKLEQLYREVNLREVLLWDSMTERQEVTFRLLRELAGDSEIFGTWQVGTPDYPALTLESLHYLKKSVSGQSLVRPWWWFDPAISGEALADVGTHLADLAIWFIAPEYPVDYQKDIHFVDADRWPLILSENQFSTLTALPGYPAEIAGRVVNGQLYYAGNNTVNFTLRGVNVKLGTRWEYENPTAGGDTHSAVALGTQARVTVRQLLGSQPEVFVRVISSAKHEGFIRRLEEKVKELQAHFPGLAAVDLGTEAHLIIPDALRTGHEAHFSAVLEEFARYFNTPRSVPHCERANALAKYYITTKGVELGRLKRHSR